MRKSSKMDLASTFSDAIAVKKSSKLENRIKELEAEIEKKSVAGDVIDANVDEILPNINQPRKSFYVVKKLAESIAKHDLKNPISLVEIDGQLVIYDGECRWRAVKSLGHKTIKAIIIPYKKDTFDDDVLISSTHRNNLNALDLAEAIVEKINFKLPALKTEEIVRKLNTAIQRTKRQKKTSELLNELWDDLDLAKDEIIMAETIIYYGWNPISINRNHFPLLKLPTDLKKAIRDEGLNETAATAIAKIDHLKVVQINEKKAVNLRKEIVNNTLANNLTISQVKAEVRKVLEEINPSESVGENQKILNNCYKAVRAVPLDKLSKEERKELLSEILKLANQLQLE